MKKEKIINVNIQSKVAWVDRDGNNCTNCDYGINGCHVIYWLDFPSQAKEHAYSILSDTAYYLVHVE